MIYAAEVWQDNDVYIIDNIRIISDDLSSTTAYNYNSANEMTSMVGDETVNFSYDEWGNQISMYVAGGKSVDYDYHYGGKLSKVTPSSWPGLSTVAYDYRADGKRHKQTVTGGDTTVYQWDMGYSVVSEESSGGTLQRTYTNTSPGAQYSLALAHVDGATASAAATSYYFHDNLGSTRAIYDENDAQDATFEFAPYGDAYINSGPADVTERFTGHTWDAGSGLYYAPARYYSTNLARWTTRDPLGMVDGPNVYAYVRGNPANLTDPLGLVVPAIASILGTSCIFAAMSKIAIAVNQAAHGTYESPCLTACKAVAACLVGAATSAVAARILRVGFLGMGKFAATEEGKFWTGMFGALVGGAIVVEVQLLCDKLCDVKMPRYIGMSPYGGISIYYPGGTMMPML